MSNLIGGNWKSLEANFGSLRIPDHMNGNGHSDEFKDRMDRAERMISVLFDLHEKTANELRALAASQVVMSEAMTKLTVAQTETTDKLNALIDLIDRHLRDHREGQP
jgi:hypothetical protein